MRAVVMFLGLAVVLIGIAVGAHDLGLRHTSHTIEALALGLVLVGVAVILVGDMSGRRRR